MKFLCDVHISLKISKYLKSLGYQSNHVNNILNKWNTTDDQIINYVDQNDLILISKDQDFRDEFLLKSKPKKFIKINLGNTSNNELIKSISSILVQVERLNVEYKNFMIEVSKNDYKIIKK
jgi:predicted nuclease of predicted toxin-antitoxin system